MQGKSDADILLQLQQINTELARQRAGLRGRYQALLELRAVYRAGWTHRLVDRALGGAAWLYRRAGKLLTPPGRE